MLLLLWIVKDDFEYTKASLKHLCNQDRVGPMTKGLSLTSTRNFRCCWNLAIMPMAASMLPSCTQKLAVITLSDTASVLSEYIF